MSKKKTKKKAVKKKPASNIPTAETKPPITPYPTAGPEIKEFEDLLDAHLAGDAGPPKRGPGRPPGAGKKQQEPEQPELTNDIVAGVVKIPFELWAISQDTPVLRLSDKESAQMAEPARHLLEYYLPKIPVIAYAWISLSVSTFWVMRTRLLLIQEIRKHRQKQQPARPPEPAQPGVETKFPSEVKPQAL